MELSFYLNNLHCESCEQIIRQVVSRRFDWKNESIDSARNRNDYVSYNEFSKGSKLNPFKSQKLGHVRSFSCDVKTGLVLIVLMENGVKKDVVSTDKSSFVSDIPNVIKRDFELAGFEVREIRVESNDTVSETSLSVGSPSLCHRGILPKLGNLPLAKFRRRRKHTRYCKECYSLARKSDNGKIEFSTTTNSDGLTQYRAIFAIGGMTCGNCAGIVESAINKVLVTQDSEAKVSVNPVDNTATVVTKSKQLVQVIIDSVAEAGYTAQLLEILPLASERRFKYSAAIDGITCAACASAITCTTEQLPYVEEVAVNVLSKSATFIISSIESSVLRELRETVEDCGFGFQPLGDPESVEHAFARRLTRSVNLRIDGMFCTQCPASVNALLSDFDNADVFIEKPLSLESPTVKFKYTPDVDNGVTIRSIIAKILEKLSSGNDSNIRVTIVKERTFEEQLGALAMRETYKIAIRLLASLIFAIPTFVFGVLGPSLLSKHNKFRMWLEEPILAGNTSRMTWVLFFLSTPVYFFVDDVFHRKAIMEVRALWKHKEDWKRRIFKFGSMNLLVSLGTTVAYFASIAMLVISSTDAQTRSRAGYTTTYFDAVVFLTFFLIVGRLLETYSKNRTAQAVNDLNLLKQHEATLVDRQDEGRYVGDRIVDIQYLELGDYIRISPGESPTMDCIVAQGATSFDESALTGESIPIEHKPGEQIFAGTVNVGAEAIIGRLCASDGESLLNQIVSSVRDGQLKKAPVEKLADSLTAFFVPVIVSIAIITWVIWVSLGFSGQLPGSYLDVNVGGWTVWSLEFAIAVFVIACPCGIGLAAPTALFVGGGLAAKNGILARGGGAAFQEGSRVSVVCFDKTGTLTVGGAPKVTNYSIHSNPSMKKVAIQAAKDLELVSKHPIAVGVKSFLDQEFGDSIGHGMILSVEEIAGRGLKGDFVREKDALLGSGELVSPESAILGNETFMAENNCHLSSSQIKMLADWKAEGKSVIVVAIKSISFFKSNAFFPVMLLAVRDQIRPEAKGVIKELQKEGIECWMISGDNKMTAAAIAKELGIDNVVAEVLPEEKAKKVSWIKETHLVRKKSPVVAFVGDGINDGPALAAADVGIALASGSDLAMSACDFALLSGTHTLCSLLTLLQLSRKVFQRVRFNFAWALVYNMIGIPIAAGVIYPYNNTRLSPVWASAAMAASSVSVVMSSLALRMYRPSSVLKDENQKLIFDRFVPIAEKFP
ncbi:LAFA_0E17590g1_1 [Lachancea sp. 'fantastica']|nr:LAFA_0E17590g1_1 [Lachancea sp. 'fantastica']